jgi:aspartate aminotransferase
MLAPATGFYGTPGQGKNEVRLAYVLNAASINFAMDCLEKALEQYPGTTLYNAPNSTSVLEKTS